MIILSHGLQSTSCSTGSSARPWARMTPLEQQRGGRTCFDVVGRPVCPHLMHSKPLHPTPHSTFVAAGRDGNKHSLSSSLNRCPLAPRGISLVLEDDLKSQKAYREKTDSERGSESDLPNGGREPSWGAPRIHGSVLRLPKEPFPAGWNRQDERVFLVMEFLLGQTLKHRIFRQAVIFAGQ